jgi:hypothetical protein
MGNKDRPSHVVTEDGERVTIHDLELFVGYIPDFDDEDSEISELDEETIFKIVNRTKKHMAAGANPKLVLLHKEEDNDAPLDTIGDIVSVESRPVTITNGEEQYEGLGIVGDVEMSREAFNEYLSSNAYPRRSAEIWDDGHMSEVALLGRETPARPLRDTKFTRPGVKRSFSRPATYAEVSPGPSNVYVPSGTNRDEEEKTMPDILEHEEKELLRKLRAENGMLQEEITKMKAQLAELEAVNGDDEAEFDENGNGNGEEDETIIAQMNGDDDEDMEYCQEDGDDDEEDKQMFSRISRTKYGTRIVEKYQKVKRQRNLWKAKFKKAQKVALKTKFSRLLDLMERDGYRVKAHRDHMLSELATCNNPTAKIKFWRGTMKRSPIGKRLNMAGTRVSTQTTYSAEQRQSASEETVKRMTREGLDSTHYKRVFDEELKRTA